MSTADTSPELWERQPAESPPAFEAFAAYRDAGLARTLRGVAAKLGKSATLIARWSSTHQWVARTAAWDAEEDRLWRAALAGKRRRAVDRHLRTAELAQSKVAQRLLDLEASEMTVTELTRLLDVAVRIERDALGEPIKHEITGPDGDPLSVRVAEYAAMTSDRRFAAAQDLAAAVAQRARAAASTDDDDD